MPVYGSVANELRRHRTQTIPQFMRSEAYRARNTSRQEVRKRTPVGRRVDPHTGADLGPSGRLQRSVRGIAPRPTTPGHSYETGAHSERREASIVENGARPHTIRARGRALHFWRGGTEYFRGSVQHPGFEGRHMFKLGIEAALALEMVGANERLQRAIAWER